jgi:glycosyltransferase involved in cell wall biosynthesis
MSRRVLFLTYYFPPSGGPGVQRSLKFVKYLPEFGWEPVVVTVKPERASYPDLDPKLAREVPAGTQVVRTSAWDPYALYARLQGKAKQDAVAVGFLGEAEMTRRQRAARWVRANVFLPDARVGWVPFALRRALKLLPDGAFDAVFTTGPPHSTHLAGYLLARRSGLPWLADFRDPWTGIDYYESLPMTAPARGLDRALERRVLRHADAVTVVSPSMLSRLTAHTRAPVAVVQNGFDPQDFEVEPPSPAPGFVLCYVGNLNEARNPTALWRALETLDAKRSMPELRVRLVGNIDPVALRSAREHGLGNMIETHPYVPHEEAVREMRQSTLLLLSINRVAGAEGIITGKLYEYVASGRPVLGLGPAEGDAARVLASSDAGRMLDCDDAAGVAEILRAHYASWKAGRPVEGAPPERASRYSRRTQTGELAALLERIS